MSLFQTLKNKISTLANSGRAKAKSGLDKIQAAADRNETRINKKRGMTNEQANAKFDEQLNRVANSTPVKIGGAVVQGTARSGGAIVQSVSKKLGLTDKDSISLEGGGEGEQVLKETIFGKGDLKGFGGVGEQTLKDFGVQGEHKTAAPILGAALSISDLFGGGKSGLIKSISKSEDVVKIAGFLKKLKVSEDAIPELSKTLSTVKDTNEVRTLLKGVPKEKGIISKVAGKVADKLFGAVDTVEGYGKTRMQKVKSELYDRMQPLYDLTRSKNLAPENDPYVSARLFAGRFGKIQNRLDDLSDIVTAHKDIVEEAKQYGKLERFQEIARNGITKLEGGRTAAQVDAEIAQMESKLGDKLPQVKEFLDNLRGYTDRLLGEAYDAGIISTEAYQKMLASGEKYLPLERLDYLAEQLDNMAGGTKSFSVPTQNIFKKMKGSTKEVADPLASIVSKTYKTVELIERNKVAQQLAALVDLPEMEGVIKKLGKGGYVEKGYGKFSALIDGVKRDFQAPIEVVDAMKGLNAQEADLITRIAGKFSGLLRAGATTLNLAFLPVNAIRDYQTASIVSKVGFTPFEWLRGFASAVGRGDDYKAFMESGASFSGYFQGAKRGVLEATAGDYNKVAKKMTKDLIKPTTMGGKALKAAKTILNPVSLIETLGETIELAPRIGVYKRSIRKGKAVEEAALNARNATVDFAKAGSVMKVANMWIPFLNARTQGIGNSFGALRNKPVQSALKIGAYIGAPQVATYMYNVSAHPEIWDDIAQFEKDNNFIIIYGDERDSEGNPTQVMKIPKGDLGKVFGNPLEAFLEHTRGTNEKGFQQIGLEVINSASPIDFVRDGKVDPNALIASGLPPTVRALAESGSGYNYYQGRSFIPQTLQKVAPEEQYTENTPKSVVKVGQWLGISPLKLENFIKTQFAGVGTQLMSPDKLATTVSKRFSGAKGGDSQQADFDKLGGYEEEYNTDNVKEKRTLKKYKDELFKASPEERPAKLQELIQQGVINENNIDNFSDMIIDDALGINEFEKVLSKKPNEVKAKFLLDKLGEMEGEQRIIYFEQLIKKGLISDDLLDQLGEELLKRSNN